MAERERDGPVRRAGDYVTWDGGCLFIGVGVPHVVPVHAHYAMQVAFGDAHGIRFRASDDEPWTTYDVALVPSRHPHAMDTTCVHGSAVLFVEPETREGRALETLLRSGIADAPAQALDGARDALFAAWQRHGAAPEVVRAAWRVIHALTGGIEPSAPSDERILRAIAYIKRRLDHPLTLDVVAAEAYLSPGRFRHLFVEQTGMTLRAYILWRRLLSAFELAATGHSLSAAAHGAGFADAAHLTRTSRRMFGLTPSFIRLDGPRPELTRPAALDAVR